MERVGSWLAGARPQDDLAEAADRTDADIRIQYVELKLEALNARLGILEQQHGIAPAESDPA